MRNQIWETHCAGSRGGWDWYRSMRGVNQSQSQLQWENPCKPQENKPNKTTNWAHQAIEEMHFSAVTFNKSMSQGSRGEARKQIYIKRKEWHQHLYKKSNYKKEISKLSTTSFAAALILSQLGYGFERSYKKSEQFGDRGQPPGPVAGTGLRGFDCGDRINQPNQAKSRCTKSQPSFECVWLYLPPLFPSSCGPMHQRFTSNVAMGKSSSGSAHLTMWPPRFGNPF